jgi:hypothetical protein
MTWGDVVMGPCPGCGVWTVQFNPHEIPAIEVEQVISEHAMECPGLVSAMITAMTSGDERVKIGFETYLLGPPPV